MDDSAWPSVPWTEFLNDDFEDDHVAAYCTVNESSRNSKFSGGGQTPQPVDAPDSSAVTYQEWRTEACLPNSSIFPCDFNQALPPFTGPICDGELHPGKLS
jgi:hypothetical protein